MTPQRNQPKTPPPAESTSKSAPSAEPVSAPEETPPPVQETEPPPEPYWADYGDAPAPQPPDPRLSVNLLLQVRDLVNTMMVDGAQAPPRVGKGDAVLRVHLELFDSSGSRFQQPADIPLPGFETQEAVQMGVGMVQAALTALVIRPLMGKLTAYLDGIREQTSHSEVPLTVYRPPNKDDDFEDDDLERAPVVDLKT